jgi:uncharacterized protein YbjQ (UPF0145 family)
MFSLFKSKRQKWKEQAEATFANYIPSLQGMDGPEIGFVLDLAAKIARASTITLSDNEPYVLAFGDPLRVKQDDAFRYLQYWKETMIADGATEEGQAKVGAMSIWWLSLMGGTIPEMRSKTKVMWNELERGFKYCEVFIPDRMVPAGFGLDHYLGLSQTPESGLVKPSDNAEPSTDMSSTCPVCGNKVGFFAAKAYVKVNDAQVETHFKPCFKEFQSDPERYGGKPLEEDAASREQTLKRRTIEAAVERIKLTTAFSFSQYDVDDELGIVTSECVFGMNIFRDFFAGLTDFFGGRSEASQKVLRDARETCLTELKKEAYELGADGVIGIDLDYSEISGKGKGMLFLVASGTAVKFKE